jgi:hypothetical protein
MSAQPTATLDPRFIAGIDLLRRTGAQQVQVRYSDDEQPIVWMVVVGYTHQADHERRMTPLDKPVYEAAAAMNPWNAAVRLCERMIDGGSCIHCKRPAGVSDDWQHNMPLASHICWYVYDPEKETFRRSCEGET